jgi:hypothetical protein
MSDNIAPAHIGPFDGYEIDYYDGPEPEVGITLTGVDGAADYLFTFTPWDAHRIGEALIEVATNGTTHIEG